MCGDIYQSLYFQRKILNQMDTENIEIQENELLALESIYDERQYIGAQSGKGGQILVSIEVPEKFQMSYQVPQRRIPQM